MDKTTINWFPGHMAKANKKIQESIKNVDLIIEVVDARAIKTTSNNDFNRINKPILKVALKSDLADLTDIKNKEKIVIGSTKDKNFRKILFDRIKKSVEPTIAKKKAKGFVNPILYVMVVGLPNVGKSSLINLLANKNVAITGNMPAVTKKQTNIKIDKNLYLQDNPGIFFKNVDSASDGYVLALVGTIKKEILPMEEVLHFWYDFVSKFYSKLLNNQLSYNDFIKQYANERHFIASNNQPDISRAQDCLFNEIINGKFGKINYEKKER